MGPSALDQRPPAGPIAVSCPRCGAGVRGDVRDLGTFFLCRACGVEWVENLALDFRTD